jgi:hypothetical protein
MAYAGEKKRDYQLNWITARKRKYIEQIGCCFFCGSHDEIEIHHIDPEEKESHKIWSWSDDRLENELRKCVAMCHTCHERFHQLLKRKAIKHGTETAYRLGCRCSDCRNANTEARRKYRRGSRPGKSDMPIPVTM